MKKVLILFALIVFPLQTYAADLASMSSWNEGPAKAAITRYVDEATMPGHRNFIPVESRIAVFDNDGTLWTEQPLYSQVYFAFDRIRYLAPKNPQWKTQEPFKSVLAGDERAVFAQGEKAVAEIMAVTHAGMTTDDFSQQVKTWLATAKHPKYHVPYTELTYEPMKELVAYLQEKNFKTFIVSGGGVEFMRAWAEEAYGIPPEQVIGSSAQTKFEIRDGKPVLVKQAEVDFVDDKEGKPVGINKFIGRRPAMAFGNSDGDLQMLQWTTGGDAPGFAAIVHHTDAEREYAYDRKSQVGKLDKALDAAQLHGWTVIDMKRDWKKIFANVQQKEAMR